jgi:hypothetical protein
VVGAVTVTLVGWVVIVGTTAAAGVTVTVTEAELASHSKFAATKNVT